MNIVIVDDHPLIRRGLIELLSLEDRVEILGEATNSKEAFELFQRVKPDLAVVDLRLGGESGLDLISYAIQKGVSSKFVVLTSSANEKDFNRAKEIGVDGYVLKEALPEELLHALNVISKGRKYYDPGVLDMMMNVGSVSIYEDEDLLEQLTPKEKEVLVELGKGRSNKEISQQLYITEYTVKKHVSQILSKLELTDRTQAALYANAKGVVTYVVS